MSKKKYLKQLEKVKETLGKQAEVLENVMADLENEDATDDS